MGHLSRSRRWRFVIPIVLLGMIFMRMIWMQLRAYPPSLDPRAIVSLDVMTDRMDEHCHFPHYSPAVADNTAKATANEPAARVRLSRAVFASLGYAVEGLLLCREDWLQDRSMSRLNQWLFIGAVIAAALMTRFIASNWTIAPIVAAMLLSRGRLLADLGTISADGAIATVLMFWLATTAHFLRTGATASLIAMALAVACGVAYDRSLVALTLVPPLMIGIAMLRRRHLVFPVIRRFRGTRQRARQLMASVGPSPSESGGLFQRLATSARWMVGLDFAPSGSDPRQPADYARGSLFRTIQVPFFLWLFARRRYLKLGLASLGLAVATTLAVATALLWAASPPGGVGSAIDWRLASDAVRAAPPPSWAFDWLVTGLQRIDFHLGLCIAVVVVSAVQSPAAGLPAFLELVWTAIAAFVLVTLASFGLDALDQGVIEVLRRARLAPALFQEIRSRNVLSWFEPVILSLGTAGLYNLMKVLDTRLTQRL